MFQIIEPSCGSTTISVLIPTMDANRRGCFQALLLQLRAQSFQHFEIIVIKGDNRQGRSINIGAALASGTYLLTLDDDTSLPDPESFTNLVTIMEQHSDIGIAGGNAIIPKHASNFVKKAMQQIPRRAWTPVTQITDSDLAQHPCLIMRTEEFKHIGGENELIPRGLDPYLRQEFRKIGKRVVVVPGVNYYHLLPDRLRGLMRQFYRNGTQAAYVNIHYPQWVIETPSNHGTFRAHQPFALRLLRLPLRLLGALVCGEMIRFLCETSYGLGFVIGWFADRFGKNERKPLPVF
ncbi:MAG: glycosyltransferase [Chitinivibrionales bacterium]|nr:glycosyltransferase [Chitinivibrionales bacterium]